MSNSSGNTGVLDEKGLAWGDLDDKNARVKCFGLEDIWGNRWEKIDGFYCDNNYNVLTATQNFKNTGEGYDNQGTINSLSWGYVKAIHGTTELGFLPKTVGGSSTTYWCDCGCVSSNKTLCISTCWDYGEWTGMFVMYMYEGDTWSDGSRGARLMYV